MTNGMWSKFFRVLENFVFFIESFGVLEVKDEASIEPSTSYKIV